MEFLGAIALFLMLFYMGMPKKVKRLQHDIKKIKKVIKGEGNLSNMLKELEGKKCKIHFEDGILVEKIYEVISVEDEWIKVSYEEKKEKNVTKIIRIDTIAEIVLV